MQQNELHEFLLDTLAELATLHADAAAVAERAWSALNQQDKDNPHNLPHDDQHQSCLPRDRLLVNPTIFIVEWHGRCCHLGPTILFKLMQRLARRPGRYLTYDTLLEDVWGRPCSDAAIRSAIKRLRHILRDAGMPELAAAIKGQTECYGIFLNGDHP